MVNHRGLRHLLVAAALLIGLIIPAASAFASAGSTAGDDQNLDPATEFYVPNPNHDAVRQIAELTSQGHRAEADKIRAIINTPTAVWVESGSPKDAEQHV